jgi:hypothetical protein
MQRKRKPTATTARERINLGTTAINPFYRGARPQVTTPAERTRLHESRRDVEDALRRLENAEREVR